MTSMLSIPSHVHMQGHTWRSPSSSNSANPKDEENDDIILNYTVEYLREAVSYCLRNRLYENALFLAERLHAEMNDESSLFVLADCHFQLGDVKRCYFMLLNSTSMQCLFLLAFCCMKLEKPKAAIQHLMSCQPSPTATSSLTDATIVPDPAAWHYLLALCYKRLHDHPMASQHFARALLLNPFIYLAYEELCKMGKNLPADKAFKQEHAVKNAKLRTNRKITNTHFENHVIDQKGSLMTATSVHPNYSENSFRLNSRSFRTPSTQSESSFVAESPYERNQKLMTSMKASSFQTPIQSRTGHPVPEHYLYRRPLPDDLSTQNVSNLMPLLSSTSSRQRTMVSKFRLDAMPSVAKTIGRQDKLSLENHVPAIAVNEHNIASMSPEKCTPVSNKTPSASSPSQSYANGRWEPLERVNGNTQHKNEKMTPDHSDSDIHLMNYQQKAFAYIVHVLTTIGEAYRYACFYKMSDAIFELKKLPRKHYETSRILVFAARCLQEKREFDMAEKVYLHARRLDPYLLTGMEYYSSVLWHEKKIHDLAFLSQEMLSLDSSSSSAWCAAGNAYSSRGDHLHAIECFTRAIQLKPYEEYAYLCSGYEFLAMNDYDLAEKYFSHVLSMDERHYIARYGIGLLYFKKEDYGEALLAWKTAAEINPTHAVLFSCLGMALQGMGQAAKALQAYDKALALDPEDTLAQFKRSCLLLQLNRLVESKSGFMILLHKLPKEALVKAALAHVCNLMNEQLEATKYTAMAESLDARAMIIFRQTLAGRPILQTAVGLGDAVPF